MKLFIAFSPNPIACMTLKHLDWSEFPLGLLVSYYYLDVYRDKVAPHTQPPVRMLDSGAFSAWKSGQRIDREALTRETQNAYWHEAVALDVVGDWRASYDNYEAMREAGSAAFPVFHIGEPIELLRRYCTTAVKVGLSCRFGEPMHQSLRFFDQCFTACYPFPYHCFGSMRRDILMRYPFASADSVTWALRPHAFGGISELGITRGPRLRLATAKPYTLYPGLRGFVDMQAELEGRWRTELKRISAISESKSTALAN